MTIIKGFESAAENCVAYAEERGETPFDEGGTAGYLGLPRDNPYRKGIFNAEAEAIAAEWDAGYAEGGRLALADLHDKRLSACR